MYFLELATQLYYRSVVLTQHLQDEEQHLQLCLDLNS